MFIFKILIVVLCVCQVLRLHLDFSDSSRCTSTIQRSGRVSLSSGILASAVVLTSIGVLVYLKRSKV